MTEAQLVELIRAIKVAQPSLSWVEAVHVARWIGLHDTTWQDPLACRI